MDFPELLSRYEEAKSKRASFEGTWQDIASMLRPELSFHGPTEPGAVRRANVYDDTAALSSAELASLVEATMFNTSLRWFELRPADPSYAPTDDDLRWLYGCTTVMLQHFESPLSLFSVAVSEMLLDWAQFHTGVLLMNEHAGKKLPTFQALPLASMYLVDDEDGEMVEWHRKFCLSGASAVNRFGPEAFSKEFVDKAAARPHDPSDFVHSIIRNWAVDPRKRTPASRPCMSAYLSLADKRIVKEGGFDESPILVTRYMKMAGETYGRGPSFTTLPSNKALNRIAKTALEAGELMVRPPIVCHANGIEGRIDTRPGAINYVRQGTREFPQPLVTGANPDAGEKELLRRGSRIERAYMADKFRLPDNDRMTATEIAARRQQSMLLASPVVARLIVEAANPIVSRTFASGMRKRLFGRAPATLAQMPLSVVFTNPMTGSRSAANLDSWNSTMAGVAPIAEAKPEVLDNFDVDQVARRVAFYSHLDPMFLRKQPEVKSLRDARAQQATTEAALANAEMASKAVKNVAPSQARR